MAGGLPVAATPTANRMYAAALGGPSLRLPAREPQARQLPFRSAVLPLGPEDEIPPIVAVCERTDLTRTSCFERSVPLASQTSGSSSAVSRYARMSSSVRSSHSAPKIVATEPRLDASP